MVVSTFCSGSASEFKKNFETPILKSRDAYASEAEQKRGQEKLQEVTCFTNARN